MSVRVSFLAGEPEPGADAGPSGVLAPLAALRRDAQGEYAWVVTEGRLRRQPLRSAGSAGEGRAVVTEGLAGGEALVLGEVEGLRENLRVRARESGGE